MPLRISFAESAVSDLEEMIRWYDEQLAPDVGRRLAAEIVQKVERLAEHPESGRVVPEFESPQIREIIHSPFRLVYRLGPGRVRIVRIWRGERQLRLP